MLNELFVVFNYGYEIGVMVFGLKGKGDYIYVLGYNFIKVYVKVYRIYEKDFKSI